LAAPVVGLPATDPAVHPGEWPRLLPALAPDLRLESRAAALLAAMTLEQKVGQLIQPDIASITPEDVRHFALGSILNGGNSSPNGDEFAPPSEWLALADRFYDASLDAARGPHAIPTMWGTDAVHGHGIVRGASIFPHNIGLGAAHDAELVGEIGAAVGAQVRATGIDWVFAPTLAVVQNYRWGRSYESFSEDPNLVIQMETAIDGLQGSPGQLSNPDRVLATAKHYAGDCDPVGNPPVHDVEKGRRQ